MLNNIHNIFMKLDPQTQARVQSIYNSAMNSGNPEQYLNQQFGNNPAFMRAMELKKTKSTDELNTYLGNVYNTMNR